MFTGESTPQPPPDPVQPSNNPPPAQDTKTSTTHSPTDGSTAHPPNDGGNEEEVIETPSSQATSLLDNNSLVALFNYQLSAHFYTFAAE